MPRLNNINMEIKKLPRGSFGYSAVRMQDLGACEYTLVTIVQDASTSVTHFKTEMEACLAEIVKACITSPRADNLLIRYMQFGTQVEEIHGFKLLQNCQSHDYRDSIRINGCTALFDATLNAVQATTDYTGTLLKNNLTVNSIIFIITDGQDNTSQNDADAVKKALNNVYQKEALEALTTILIGVGMENDPAIATDLKDFKDRAGLTEFVELKEANADTLARLVEFVALSISSQSMALGNGTGSQSIQLTF